MENSVVSTRTKLSIVGTAGLAFCGVLVETSMNVTFPTLSRQFGTTINAVQWVTTAYLLAVACTMVIAADLQRRFKWQRLTTLGGILFIVGDVLCATAPALWPLLGGRLIQGVATGLVMPLVFTIIMRQVPHGIQGRYVGTAGMVVALAPSLGPTYGGWATQQFGWPIIFWLVLPIGIVMWLIALKTIQQPKATPQNLFPLRQLIMIMFTFVGLTLGLNNAGTDGLLSVAALVPLVIAIVAVFIFIRLSLHQPTALINLKIFTNRNFVLLLGIYFLIQFVQIGLTFILPTYAQLVTHQSVMASGMTTGRESSFGDSATLYGAATRYGGQAETLLGGKLDFSFSPAFTHPTDQSLISGLDAESLLAVHDWVLTDLQQRPYLGPPAAPA